MHEETNNNHNEVEQLNLEDITNTIKIYNFISNNNSNGLIKFLTKLKNRGDNLEHYLEYAIDISLENNKKQILDRIIKTSDEALAISLMRSIEYFKSDIYSTLCNEYKNRLARLKGRYAPNIGEALDILSSEEKDFFKEKISTYIDEGEGALLIFLLKIKQDELRGDLLCHAKNILESNSKIFNNKYDKEELLSLVKLYFPQRNNACAKSLRDKFRKTSISVFCKNTLSTHKHRVYPATNAQGDSGIIVNPLFGS